jgi:hypothetical protein
VKDFILSDPIPTFSMVVVERPSSSSPSTLSCSAST